jgi:outer membrane protein OmpA-like peptidoglycan-associated protein
MYFTRNNYFQKKFGKDAAGVNNLKIFKCTFDGEKWSEEANFNYNSDEYSVGHPALSADGKTLYFVSDMPGGVGGTDMWKVAVNDDGSYGTPVNLGTSINTEGNEMFPFIHPTGMLFFSSNGLAGLGGLDVFAASPQGDSFSAPFNLGMPLNSAADDFAFILDQEQNFGYVSSNRAGGKGSDDIYSVKVTTPIKPGYRVEGIAYDKTTGLPLANAMISLKDKSGSIIKTIETGSDGSYVFNVEQGQEYSLEGKKTDYYDDLQKVNTSSLNPNNSVLKKDLKLEMDPGLQIIGLVLDKATGKPIEGAKVKVVKAGTQGTFGEFTTDAAGKLGKPVEGMKVGDAYEYIINVEKEGYLNEMKRVPGTVTKGKNIEFRVDMNKLEIGGDLGKMVAINPIYFDKDKDFIRPDAAVELDKIVAVMKEYPNMVIELGSHTDCRASKSYNEKLSDRRAKSSAAYIISKGVDKSRIYGKGYGESELVNDCACEGNKKSTCSEEEHQLNRRTIFKIVKM